MITMWFGRALLALTAVTLTQSRDTDWPQFLGPHRNGTADISVAAPSRLVEAWRKPIGSSSSSIVLSRGRAFTLFSDGDDDYLLALDAATGSEVWRSRIGKTHADVVMGPGSTPAVAGDIVVALGSSCALHGVSARDGKVIWTVDLAATFKTRFATRGGCSISPLVLGTRVVVPTGSREPDRLVAFDAATGARAWSSAGAQLSANTSPAAWDSTAGPQILYHHVKPPGLSGLSVVNVNDGARAWEIDLEQGMSNTAPLALPNGRVLVQTWSGSTMIEGGVTPRRLWSNTELTAGVYPAVHLDGYLYGFGGNSGEFLKCVDAATGALKWTTRTYRGAAVLAGRTLILQSESAGLLRLVSADPGAYRELARLQVLKPGATTFSSPSVANDHVFVRNLDEIVAVSVR